MEFSIPKFWISKTVNTDIHTLYYEYMQLFIVDICGSGDDLTFIS